MKGEAGGAGVEGLAPLRDAGTASGVCADSATGSHYELG